MANSSISTKLNEILLLFDPIPPNDECPICFLLIGSLSSILLIALLARTAQPALSILIRRQRMSDLDTKLNEMLLRGQAEVAGIDRFAPIPPKEDCAVCFVPLPIRNDESCYMHCCGKVLCFGCIHRSQVNGLKDLCALCRQPFARADAIYNARLKKRMEHKDPIAFIQMAQQYWMGEGGVEENDWKALDLFIKAAEFGSAEAYCNVASKGFITGWKASAWLEVSAKKGFYKAHEYLGEIEETRGNINTAIKHWKVAASAGSQYSLDMLRKAFKNNQFPIGELAQVLRAFLASNDETKSDARDEYRRVQAGGRVY